jgi:hypothetical protein
MIEQRSAVARVANIGPLKPPFASFGIRPPPRRCEMVRAALLERLGRPRLRGLGTPHPRPGVELLLEIDREYRDKAVAGSLPRIAPKRFNPSGGAWLPVLHTRRGEWNVTALYFNSRLAHELGRARDWVIIYYESEEQPEGQCTVVTETRGPGVGLRVVRGRESECLELWKHEHAAIEPGSHSSELRSSLSQGDSALWGRHGLPKDRHPQSRQAPPRASVALRRRPHHRQDGLCGAAASPSDRYASLSNAGSFASLISLKEQALGTNIR